MKNIYFFGCSYTAGDELADDEFFPWKKDCSNPDEYYTRKIQWFDQTPDYSNVKTWEEANRKKAYPALLQNNNSKINSVNKARPGSSMREVVLTVVETVSKATDISHVCIQIPPGPRELIINGEWTSTLQFTPFGMRHELHGDYIKESLKLKSDEYFSINEILDLMLVTNFLKSKSIDFTILDLDDSAIKDRRANILSDRWSWLSDWNSEQVLDLKDKICNRRLLGWHFDSSAHEIIADEIEKVLIYKNII